LSKKVCLVVGTDRLGRLPEIIERKYNLKTEHWTGREKKLPAKLPKNCELVLLITGYINHPTAKRVKELAKNNSVKLVCIKRGAAELEQTA
jgi:hypothetical protein